MKRIFNLVCAAALILSFTACEDVPAPYVVHSQGGSGSTLLSESFASSLGKFANYTTDGGVEWKNSYSCATATGYDSSTKTNTDGTAYLISPTVDLTEVDSAHITYDYILRYNRKDTYQRLIITEDFEPSFDGIENQEWETLFENHTEGSDYTTFSSVDVNIPEKYYGKKVRVALRFQCETSSSTWEVKNFKISKGSAENGDEPGPTPGPDEPYTLPYTSANLRDGFTTQTRDGGPAWSLGNTYAKATGYDSGSKTTTATETWLITPAINTTVETNDECWIDFDYVLRYVGSGTDVKGFHKVLVSTDYDGDMTTATWTDLGFEPVESATKDWTFYAAKSIYIPEEFMNKEKVYFAFRFECTSENSTTWELKNLSIHQGQNEEPDDPTPPQPTGDNLLANGDFETWSGGQPTYWKSTTTASSATLSQSNDAHGGSYSVCVGGNTSANKRISYKELNLKAGTYTMTFFAKAATSAGGSVRPGWATDASGKMAYNYGDYVNDLSTSEWTEVTFNFTLDVTTKVNILVMNPKSPGADVLIDDFELKTSNGGIDGGGDDPTPTPPAETSTYVKINETSEITDGTYVMGAYVDNVWKVAQVDASRQYGYLYVTDAEYNRESVTFAPSNGEELTIKQLPATTRAAYTIQDAQGRYLYMSGTYTSFNYSESMPESGAEWVFEMTGDGLQIINTSNSNTVQYSIQYKSYGCYPELNLESNRLPYLFKKQ